ncbi:MAG: TolC family protein [Mariprofundaceae bacterium]|nr:TolC family protein [Mariprofundaceae bacterium]
MTISIIDIINVNVYVSPSWSQSGLFGYLRLLPAREGIIQHMRSIFVFLFCSMILFAAVPVRAEPVGLGAVIRNVLERHPDIPLIRLKTEQIRTDQQRIEGQLDPVLTVSLLVSDSQDPSNSKFNPIKSFTSQQIKAGISKPLANGGTLSLNLDYNRNLLEFQLDPTAFARFDPFYHNQIDLTYRQPLLRGAGRPAYHQELTAVLADASASHLQERVTARTLSRKAIQLYFDIAVDEANRRLAADAEKRASKLLKYQRNRERFGLIEKADRLQAEALLATRRMDLANARGGLIQDTTALNRLMLRNITTPITTRDKQRLDIPLPDLDDAMGGIDKRRPELLALDSRLKAAEARLEEVKDTDSTQVDLVAQIGSRSLAGAPGTAIRQGFSLADRFASIGVEISDTVVNNAAKAAIRKAALEREQVLAERRQTIELIKDDLANILALIRTGRKTLAAAGSRVSAEQKKHQAELVRYREGRSDTATVIQFEGDLRAAEIEAALRRIALLRNQRQLAWVQGSLFSDLGITFALGAGNE